MKEHTPETKTVKITIFMDIETDYADHIKIIERHADRLLDLDSWPEIQSVYGVKVEEINEDDDAV